MALCALDHVLFDLGVVGITQDRRITVARDYVATTSGWPRGRRARRATDPGRPTRPGLGRHHLHRLAPNPGLQRRPPTRVTGPAGQVGPVGREASKPSSG